MAKKKTTKKPLKKYQSTNSQVGTFNPDNINVESAKGHTGPYTIDALVNHQLRNPVSEQYRKKGYGPKNSWMYVKPGELTKQDTLDINTNRAPTVSNFQLVDYYMKKGEKFPGLTEEFLKGFKTYQNLPDKYKKKGGPITSMDQVQRMHSKKKK